ncbi:MAG: hypothetical protein IJ031_05975 [Oscillospiraceae bacterium]|nr:hypothetical protein [Oscillospiraceae bacterium]MBQ8377571.1 hypothetical protein [Oscillospiraceae bacterium]MBQ8884122.1 hypothetical protein [Oscillospiraceae bacterium]
MKNLLNFTVNLVFLLAMSWGFAEVISTGRITGGTVFPIGMLFLYWIVGISTDKPKKKTKRPAPHYQTIRLEMRGTGWKEVR